MKDHYLMFAAYNVWANNILFNAVSELSDEQYHKECGAFFGSVHGTLNHVLVGDIIWMSRFQGTNSDLRSLDTILHENFDDLKSARIEMDAKITNFINGLEENDFSSTFTFQTIVDPVTLTQSYSPALAHFFNHQTHHRGQVHGLLSQLIGDPPSLDLIYFQRIQEAS